MRSVATKVFPDFPAISVLKTGSMNMEAFFVLAGFALSATTPREIPHKSRLGKC